MFLATTFYRFAVDSLRDFWQVPQPLGGEGLSLSDK